MKPFISDKEKRLLMVVIPLQAVANVAIIYLDEFTPAAESWFTCVYGAWVPCCWVPCCACSCALAVCADGLVALVDAGGCAGGALAGSTLRRCNPAPPPQPAPLSLSPTHPHHPACTRWRDILHLVDIVCCCLVLFPIVWSIKQLRDASGALAAGGWGACRQAWPRPCACLRDDCLTVAHAAARCRTQRRMARWCARWSS